MKHALTAIAAAVLLTLTGCGNSDTASTSEALQSPSVESANQVSDGLQPNSDGYDMRVMYQWIPELPTIKPAEAALNIQFEDESQESKELYVTQSNSSEQVPSIDSGQYLTKEFHIPFGGTITAQASVNDPTDGRLTCLIVETAQEVVLDYQEMTLGSDESLSCMGFTHQEHDYEAGKPPVEVKFN